MNCGEYSRWLIRKETEIVNIEGESNRDRDIVEESSNKHKTVCTK